VLQEQGCDLDRVLGRYEQQLTALEPEARRLPNASGRFVESDGDMLAFEVETRASDPGPLTVVVRVRADASTPVDDVRSSRAAVTAGARARVQVPRPILVGQRFEFQIGAAADDETRPVFTRWQSSTLR
jgi:hypothetical protein